MKAQINSEIDKNDLIPAIDIENEKSTNLYLHGKIFNSSQPDMLDNEFYNTLIEHNDKIYLCHSGDLEFLNNEEILEILEQETNELKQKINKLENRLQKINKQKPIETDLAEG